LAALESAVADRDLVIAALRAENAELRARLDSNSGNSSKPPSSDSPFAKPAPKSLRGKSGRKPGGQPGHPGNTLRQVAEPDEVVVHEPGACYGCGAGLAGRPVTGSTARQVFDLPEVAVAVTEHHFLERECACGQRTRAVAPEQIGAPVQYGPRITAIIAYLYMGQFLSKTRTAQALSELFAVPVSEGTVSAAVARAAAGLATFTDLVRERISAAPVVNFDETGLRVEASLHWVHSASTAEYSLLAVHPKRGVEGMAALGILPSFTGIAVHDAWAPYDTYTASIHALCNAHVLRELQAVTDHAAAGDPDGWCWATQTAEALRDLRHLAATAAPGIAATDPASGVDPDKIAEILHAYRSAIQIGATATAARTSKLEAKHHALAKRLTFREADYLRFLHDPAVPFDNNAAEREVRMVKLRQKVSGSQRTLRGAQRFVAIRSYTATATKHGINMFHALVELVSGRVWLPT
jgi:transposase